MAAYHSMSHFRFNLPLTDEKIEKETKNIIEIGRVNGYPERMVSSIIEKHRKKKYLRNFSTFYQSLTTEEPVTRASLRFFPKVTSLLKPVYKMHNIELVHRNKSSLKNSLGSIKDVPPDLHKSGIYRVQCLTCGTYYFGLTIRKLFVRYWEHERSANWKQKTAAGKHIHRNHLMNISTLKLVQEVRRP